MRAAGLGLLLTGAAWPRSQALLTHRVKGGTSSSAADFDSSFVKKKSHFHEKKHKNRIQSTMSFSDKTKIFRIFLLLSATLFQVPWG